MEYLKTFTKEIEQVSVDECYMDFTKIAARYSSPIDGALEIKEGIKKKFGFTVNVGISTNKLLAKMASDFEKPDRIHTLFPEEIEVKMWPLPIKDLYMAGKSSVQVLKKLEINTIGALAQADPDLISLHLKSHGRMLWEFANGIGTSTVQSEPEEAKGIGNSTTLREDARTMEEVCPVFEELAQSVGRRLKKAGKKAGMVSAEIKYYDFRTLSHQMQLEKPSNESDIICKAAVNLFREVWTGEPVRLLGIRTSKLSDENEPEQLTIFDMKPEAEPDEKHKRLRKAMDELNKKYGEGGEAHDDFHRKIHAKKSGAGRDCSRYGSGCADPDSGPRRQRRGTVPPPADRQRGAGGLLAGNGLAGGGGACHHPAIPAAAPAEGGLCSLQRAAKKSGFRSGAVLRQAGDPVDLYRHQLPAAA